jgi:hypothetical protein
LLLECGVPDEIADSNRRWVYVLLHGSDDFGTSWDPSGITTTAQASRLLAILEADAENTSGYERTALALRNPDLLPRYSYAPWPSFELPQSRLTIPLPPSKLK